MALRIQSDELLGVVLAQLAPGALSGCSWATKTSSLLVKLAQSKFQLRGGDLNFVFTINETSKG